MRFNTIKNTGSTFLEAIDSQVSLIYYHGRKTYHDDQGDGKTTNFTAHS